MIDWHHLAAMVAVSKTKGIVMKGRSGSQGGGRPMTQVAASRIQSATARTNGGQVSRGSFTARAQSAAAHNAGAGNNASGGSKTGK